MKKTSKYQIAIGELREVLAVLREGDPINEEIIKLQNQVLARFQPVFALEHLSQLTDEEFHSFLLFENNHHWNGLQRKVNDMCANMNTLREALVILLDETRPIDERLDEAIGMVKGMGKAVATAILLVAHPDKYGVWNNTSESGLKTYDLWPEFKRGESFGERYLKVNEILLSLVEDLSTDLWTLDTAWWYINKRDTGDNDEVDSSSALLQEEQQFGLEKYLHKFLLDNWDKTELGKEWTIYSEPGDEEAGFEYFCDVGRIDILAQDKSKTRWLVIELKRDQSSDDTVGQVLRYMGWVTKKLANKSDEVEGLIIARQPDEKLQYALVLTPKINLQTYTVDFKLKKHEKSEE